MDFSDDQGTPETPPMEKAKPVRRARAGCLPFAILLAAVVAAVAFLPQILSTPPARKIILRKLNEKIAPVKVDASWTLRWRGAQEFHTVRVEDFSRGFVFECPRATATPRWWLLLLSVKHPNLGKIVLEKPVFTLQRGAGLPAGGEDDARGKSGGLPQGGLMAFARRVTVEVEVSQGRVGEAGADDSFVAFNAALRARTFAKPLELTLEAGDGKISLAAATPPPASLRDSRRDFILRTGARLEMDRADARLANAALKLFGFNTWQVGGLATGVVSLEPVEKTAPRARVSANVDVENFLIAPNGESSRTPRRAPLSLKVETELSPNHLDIHAFELSSAWVEARASGAMRKTVFTAAPAGKIEGETKIHWAALQEDFDAVPTLPEGVRVSRGAVAAVFSAEGREDAMVFALRAEGEGLELSNGAKTAAVEPPPLLDVEVARPYTSPPALARLEARLPFLSARARGTADNAELSCGVDFDVLTRGCGALFARAPRLSGALMLNAGMAREGGAAIICSPMSVLAVLCDTVSPQGIVAETDMPAQGDSLNGMIVALDGVQDPGNVGAILRSADAAGFDAILLGANCADPYCAKALRASMGSIFRVPVMRTERIAGDLASLRSRGYAVLSSQLDGEDFFARGPLPHDFALVIGSEAAGVSRDVSAAATHRLRLPMYGGAQSLNAAVAAGIMMYDLSRNRAPEV